MTAQLAERRYEKSPLAYRTISEVAGDLEVPQHVLRFWETKFPQVRPLKRGGGRRYYRPEDVELLRRVRALLYEEGYTIKGVQRLLRERGGRSPIEAPAGVMNVEAPAAPAEPGHRNNGRDAAVASSAVVGDKIMRRELEGVLQELDDALSTLRQHIRID